MENIVTYAKLQYHITGAKWSRYRRISKDTFEKLGILSMGAEVPRRCGRPRYDSSWYITMSGKSGGPGCSHPIWRVALNGEYADMVQESIFMKLVPPETTNSQRCTVLCGPAAPSYMFPRSVCDDPFAVLFSTERTGSRTVRAYPDHCGRGCIPAFLSKAVPPSTTWRNSMPAVWSCSWGKMQTVTPPSRTGPEYVQSEYQAGVGGRKAVP